MWHSLSSTAVQEHWKLLKGSQSRRRFAAVPCQTNKRHSIIKLSFEP